MAKQYKTLSESKSEYIIIVFGVLLYILLELGLDANWIYNQPIKKRQWRGGPDGHHGQRNEIKVQTDKLAGKAGLQYLPFCPASSICEREASL